MLSVRPTDAALGAEVSGVDLSREIDERTFSEIVDLFHKHEVIFFRQQKLGPEQHLAFSRRFGVPELLLRADCCKPGYPEIVVVSNVLENGKPIGVRDAGIHWHSDLAYLKVPSRCSLFYAKEIPQKDGISLGDTMFASVTAAYDALPETMKSRLMGLKLVNSFSKAYSKHKGLAPLTEEQKNRVPDIEHPVVRTHPYTGKKCLFVSQGFTTRILNISLEESNALIDELVDHISNPRFVYRHKWQVGDFMIWDNCSAQHRAITTDYALPQRRLMERVTICGAPSVSIAPTSQESKAFTT